MADAPGTRTAAGSVLLTLASAQFLMTLDSSVMNVSIATVAKDVHTDVTGIQTAITFYTLVMAALMITGGRIGGIIGRKRAFGLGCVIYGSGSLVTSIAPNLTVLMIGWSVLEGVGAALILPAIVALVAANFGAPERPRAYGLVAAASAIAVAAGPLIGGLFTTYLSWRLVFVCEVIIVVVILVMNRRTADAEPGARARIDLVGAGLSALGMSLIVFGVLQAGAWGVFRAKSGAPELFGMSPVSWLLIGGGAVLWGFLVWEDHCLEHGREPLVDPAILRIPSLRSGLVAFFFQFLLQMGLFFTIPLFLSVALGLSAIATGVRLLPLSLTLLLAATLVPKLLPRASPRRVVQAGFAALLAGIVVMIVLLDQGAGPEIVTWPMLLAGLGVGALASQLGAVTVSAVPEARTGEVGGLQNTVTNLGASIGTAVAGAVLIAALSASFVEGITSDPSIPESVRSTASVELSSGVPFVSDAQLQDALAAADVPPATADRIVEHNTSARIQGLQVSLAVLAVFALFALATSRRLPTEPLASATATQT